MIRIDDHKFDWTAINQIYGEDSDLVALLAGKIDNALQSGHGLTVPFFQDTFCESGSISKVKISQFLLEPDTKEQIWICARKVSSLLWGSTDFAALLLRWKYVADQAASKERSERAETLQPFVNSNTKDLFLLEGGVIQDSELDASKRLNTLYSSKKRIETLQLVKQPAIDEWLKDCRDVFDYSSFAAKYRDRLLAAMHVNVCPYCNRSYITRYEYNQSVKSTADLDHFYSKSRFPYLALSLYNFVPSCQICNSRMKGTDDFFSKPHLNPYHSGFGDKVRFRLQSIRPLLQNGTSPTVKLEPVQNEEIRNSISTFRLNEIYESHTDYIDELIEKACIYNDSQLQEYLESFPGLFHSREEMQRMLYGNYLRLEDLGKRPLSKLTRDLLIDLGIQIDDTES